MAALSGAASADESSGLWRPATTPEIRRQLREWLDGLDAPGGTRAEIESMWQGIADSPGEGALARLAESFAKLDPRARQLRDLCEKAFVPGMDVKQAWLHDAKMPRWVGWNLRLFFARWLILESLVDEAKEQLTGITWDGVVDPASLLFCQAVVHHRLLERNEGLQAIELLLSNAQRSPKRYVALARLMENDLRNLKEGTLDHIARQMDDVRRRLDIGCGGPQVRRVQDGVIESLDKLIKQLEDAQKEQKASASASGAPSAPAPDSRILGGKGPGEVLRREIGHKTGWGNISPKQRDEAIQQIGREFPPHFRELIEQYFRQLATEGNE